MNPAHVALPELVRYLDGFLRIGEITDYPNALNGLQLENSGRVTRFGAAVDATLATVEMAAARGVDCLLVHHGLFWGGNQPVAGHRYRLLHRAMQTNVAVYSAHLPLDYHLGVGNNAGLCAALGFERTIPFLPVKGFATGLRAQTQLTRDQLVSRLQTAVGGGPVRVCPGGPTRVRAVGVITGGAGGMLREVAATGVDTFITGEATHPSFALAEELGVNVLLGGHYATETFGVKALAGHLSTWFGLPWEFLDRPTGL